ncbi:TfoX/Sxy family DNA transformation protein [Erwinia sp. MMLR14_017]|uniref:TfoX/Sxy family DNA transformation protein n=1 Tax=Erwinia sp. MMLR14_017 TaxID=3093842 RepID=UPI00299033BE|nr:TfoX/Sxy family DNA transformation protein [Erwinia sp. MMLR14_017]MDW8846574.1 TfoX/Sxy family DNA transformation protein [Erwinia sp. MMLR14_017]
MRDSKSKIASAKQQLSALGEINSRSQFGGYSLSVQSVVFALVSEGELYLRACEEVRPYIIEHNMKPLLFTKRGIPVELEYYRVDEPLWQKPEELIALSQKCLQGAAQERAKQNKIRRLKDLPNLTLKLEVQLRRAGICTVEMLKQQGAKRCWLKLHAMNRNLGVNILFALHGAIQGLHYEALPVATREELRVWYNETMRYQTQSQPRKT